MYGRKVVIRGRAFGSFGSDPDMAFLGHVAALRVPDRGTARLASAEAAPIPVPAGGAPGPVCPHLRLAEGVCTEGPESRGREQLAQVT